MPTVLPAKVKKTNLFRNLLKNKTIEDKNEIQQIGSILPYNLLLL